VPRTAKTDPAPAPDEETPAVETPEADAPATEVELTETREGKITAKERRSLDRFPALSDEEQSALVLVARPAVNPCLCGCGTLTKSRFAPGHDATLKERLKNTDSETARAVESTFGW
jgi:hypothetical protein